MYLTKLKLENVRLLEPTSLEFVSSDGTPRMWTVLLGENGACKSTILQCIAVAAAGEKLSRALVEDAQSFRREGSDKPASIAALFSDPRARSNRVMPPSGLLRFAPDGPIARLASVLEVLPGRTDFVVPPRSREAGDALDDLRARSDATGWFCVGYGVGRFLPEPGQVAMPKNPAMERVEGLFRKDHRVLGTDFYGALRQTAPKLALKFSKALRDVLLTEHKGERLFPLLENVELRGKGGLKTVEGLLESRRMIVELGGVRFRLPATALSDGYQSMLAWVADLLGHAFLELGETATPADLEGLALLDEVDLHLHPTWQRQLVPLLKRAFPSLQFIATTHSPLVVAGLESQEIVRLRAEGDRVVVDQEEPEPGLRTATQLLTTYFDVPFAARPELVALRRRWAELKAIERPSAAERRRLDDLEEKLRPYWPQSDGGVLK